MIFSREELQLISKLSIFERFCVQNRLCVKIATLK